MTVEKRIQQDSVYLEYEKITPYNNDKRKEYPIHALGALQEIAQHITSELKTSPAMVATSLLSVVSGASQQHFQVRYFHNFKIFPVSLFTLTIAGSGVGKSIVSGACFKPLKDVEDALSKEYKREMTEYNQMKNNKLR